jgi:hypothetical protein
MATPTWVYIIIIIKRRVGEGRLWGGSMGG